MIKDRRLNSKAALITLSMLGVHSTLRELEGPDEKIVKAWMEQAWEQGAAYTKRIRPDIDPDETETALMISNLFIDIEPLSNMYKSLSLIPLRLNIVLTVTRSKLRYAYDHIASRHGMLIRHSHSIVEKYPVRLKKPANERGAIEGFSYLLAAYQCGLEVYTEWQQRAL